MVTPSVDEGLVLGREGGRLRVLTPAGVVVAALRGKAKRGRDQVVAGDRVTLDRSEGGDLVGIAEVAPRRNELARGAPNQRGRRAIAANLDQLFVLTATTDPEPLPELLDRLLVLAEADGIPASVIVTKVDLDPGVELRARMEQIGYPVHAVSAVTGEGLDAFFAKLHGGVSVVTGPSGAGKSTLLNALEPGLALLTRTTSARIGRGRNTTVAGVMVPLTGGGFLVDTPGISEAGLWGLDPDGLIHCFPDLCPHASECRFSTCRHLVEPGCAVRIASEEGGVLPERYAHYRLFREELEGLPEAWE